MLGRPVYVSKRISLFCSYHQIPHERDGPLCFLQTSLEFHAKMKKRKILLLSELFAYVFCSVRFSKFIKFLSSKIIQDYFFERSGDYGPLFESIEIKASCPISLNTIYKVFRFFVLRSNNAYIR